ncbi:MAG: L-ribulose-5-phosphate 3-epimerase [Clostridiaceae bacterium]|nr:L-ribulose-5-phosphate 3-epimerase [Clostridiaceae bacterium]
MKKYQLGLYEKALPNELTWEERFAIAKEAGFDYIEFSIDETDARLSRLDWSLAERQEMVRLTQEADVPLRSICLSGHRKYPLGSKDAKTREKGLDIAYKAIDLAGDMGIRLIQLAGYDVYYEEGDAETEEFFAENLKAVTHYAASHEVALGFETMETPFMDTVEKSMYYVEQIYSPWLGVYPDIGNLTNASLIYGNTVNEDLQKGTGHIFAAHLKETIPGHYREIPFGTGHTDFVSNIECLKELGVRSFVGEFWYVGQENWQEDVEFAAKFLREKLDQVF